MTWKRSRQYRRSHVFPWRCRTTSLAPLSKLSGLESLELDDPLMISGIERLTSLTCLVLRHFRRVKSLAPLSALSNLRAISMSTIPSWDASRRCLEVDSLEPLRKLVNLESLRLMGIKPLDRRLDPLHDLTNLKPSHLARVSISARGLCGVSTRSARDFGPLPAAILYNPSVVLAL